MAGSVSLTYAPTYITTGLGVSAAVMANAISVRPIFGMCGNFLSGVLMAFTGRRKPLIVLAILGSVGAYLLMVNAGGSTAVLFIAMGLTGLFSNLPIPAINTTIMKTPDEPNPSIVGASSSLVNGIASFATLAVSPLFEALSNSMGVKIGLMIMFSVLALSAVFALFLFETGPKGKRALASGK